MGNLNMRKMYWTHGDGMQITPLTSTASVQLFRSFSRDICRGRHTGLLRGILIVRSSSFNWYMKKCSSNVARGRHPLLYQQMEIGEYTAILQRTIDLSAAFQ